MVVQVKSYRGFVQALSGLFISKENPNGLSPRELDVLAVLLYVIGDSPSVNAEVKEKVEAIIKQPSQVVTNYMKKFRDKGVLNKENVLSPIFKHKEIKIVRYED